ncbi:MAG: DUF484 family protein [Endozoicomonas sp.]
MTDSIASKKPSAAGKAKKKPMQADQVAEFLKNNPDFFVDRDDLLISLTLPHERGVAISLVERQVALLRERNVELRRRLGKLVDVAHDNDRLFERTRQLVLALLESQDLEQVTEILRDGLENDFGIDFHSLIIFGDTEVNLSARVESRELAESVLTELMPGSSGSQKVVCGRVRDKEQEFLFPDCHQPVGSVAIASLSFPEPLGVLALGSKDENYFRATMGTLFVGYLSDILSRVVSRFVPAVADSQ